MDRKKKQRQLNDSMITQKRKIDKIYLSDIAIVIFFSKHVEDCGKTKLSKQLSGALEDINMREKICDMAQNSLFQSNTRNK